MVTLGLTAQRIYQDIRRDYHFTGAYESVKRYIATLRVLSPTPVHRVETKPGEEMQVDFGLGSPIREPGSKTHRRSWVFRAVLSCSRRGYSEAVYRQDTETFLRVIENALRHFGGVPLLLNLDNLKAAVLKADWYDPELNPKLAEFCRHYGLCSLPCRPYTPQHKGKVERGIAYVKSNALKGLTFPSLAAENAHLLNWELTVADTRLHGTVRHQVKAMYELEKPHLQPLPPSLFASYREMQRRVGKDSYVQVDKAYYQVRIEYIGKDVWVQLDGRSVRIFSLTHELLASHLPLEPGRFSTVQGVGGIDPKGIGAKAAAQQWIERAGRYGPHSKAWVAALWQVRGIEGVRSLMAYSGLGRSYSTQAIEQASQAANDLGHRRYRDILTLLKQGPSNQAQQPQLPNWQAAQAAPQPEKTSPSGTLRSLHEYGEFINQQTACPEPPQATSTQS
jgi:transposase